jgi:hypothetical protein
MEFPFKGRKAVVVGLIALFLLVNAFSVQLGRAGAMPLPDLALVALAGYVVGSLAEWLVRISWRSARRA